MEFGEAVRELGALEELARAIHEDEQAAFLLIRDQMRGQEANLLEPLETSRPWVRRMRIEQARRMLNRIMR